ncbi:hypothetical protein J7L65_03700 [Candidatus Bathyarchaeota archaeon]|nr:hypothetical protein [Candidatus Bathyarchaeota archaeon]
MELKEGLLQASHEEFSYPPSDGILLNAWNRGGCKSCKYAEIFKAIKSGLEAISLIF